MESSGSVNSSPLLQVIIAPHADDEMIGCFSIIEKSRQQVKTYSLTYKIPLRVIYLFELSEERKVEAFLAAHHFSFEAYFVSDPKEALLLLDSWLYLRPEIYVPSRRDNHIDHKYCNKLFRRYASFFYSVDMQGAKVLPESVIALKQTALNRCYPSQRALWDNNASYYLFENILKKDYHTIVKTTLRGFTVECLIQYETQVTTILLASPPNTSMDVVMNKLLSFCDGPVKLTRGTQTLSIGE